MKVIYKIWLDKDGAAFGEGPYQLLKGVEATGSLWKAAASMEMAYSKAQKIIACCEQNLGFTLITRKVGGVSGGGSKVTREANELMGKYERVRARVEDALREKYAKYFGERADVQFYKTVAKKRGRKPVE